jgi:dihydrodipicolinate synthase/N-acetylneuraminate lyase
VTATHGVAGLKRAVTLAGFAGGTVRAPLLPVPASVDGELADALARAERALTA